MIFFTRVRGVAGAIALIGALVGCGTSHFADDGSVPPGADVGPILLLDAGPPAPRPLDASFPPLPLDAGPPTLVDAGPPIPFDAGPPLPFDAGPPIPFDAGPPLPLDAGPPIPLDAGPPIPLDAGPPGVTCGTMTCGAAEICCATFAGGALMRSCTAPSACTGATLSCDGPEDCSAGEVCCAAGGGGGGGMRGTQCRAAGACTVRVCRADGDCPAGNMCCPIMGIGVCSPWGCFGP